MERKPKLLRQVSICIRSLNYSLQTERAYIYWIKKFIFFHNVKHPKDMGHTEVNSFLSHLAVDKKVSPATQNQGRTTPDSHYIANLPHAQPIFAYNFYSP